MADGGGGMMVGVVPVSHDSTLCPLGELVR